MREPSPLSNHPQVPSLRIWQTKPVGGRVTENCWWGSMLWTLFPRFYRHRRAFQDPHNLPTPHKLKEAEQKGDLLSCKDGGGGTGAGAGACSALEANSPVHSTGSHSWEQLLRGKASLGDVKTCVLCVSAESKTPPDQNRMICEMQVEKAVRSKGASSCLEM